MTISPLAYYSEKLKNAQIALQLQTQRHQSLANARLIVFLVGLLLSLIAAAWSGYASVAVAVVFLSIFAVLVARYRQAVAEADAQQAMVNYYQRGIARLEDRWSELSKEPLHNPADSHHPYSADLDLFGSGSLYELLTLGWTPMGRNTLSNWLLHPADRATALERQLAVKELAPQSDQREAVCIRAVGLAELEEDRLRTWVSEKPPTWEVWERWGTDVVVVANAVCLAGWFAGFLPGLVALASVLIMMLWASRLSTKTSAALRGLERQSDRLQTLATLLHFVEQQSFTSPLLSQLQNELNTDEKASSAIAELSQLAERLDWPRNAFFIPIALLLLWWTRLAFRVADWRTRHGEHVQRWLDSLGQYEALQSFANLSFERPHYIFPEIVAEGRSLQATQIGHPLLPTDKCRCNDVTLGKEPQLLLISGSNMSGKSTLLRTVGINVVLALAGAPVKASTMRLTELYPGATLRVQDSLQSGISRFYAEILRLRQLLDLAQEKPLLFLVDEVLSGTNSAERRQGAAGILEALLERNAIGLATTHDLALTEIAETWKPRAINKHFADTWKDEKISFDYQLRPGVVSHGNALALMRAVGLKV